MLDQSQPDPGSGVALADRITKALVCRSCGQIKCEHEYDCPARPADPTFTYRPELTHHEREAFAAAHAIVQSGAHRAGAKFAGAGARNTAQVDAIAAIIMKHTSEIPF